MGEIQAAQQLDNHISISWGVRLPSLSPTNTSYHTSWGLTVTLNINENTETFSFLYVITSVVADTYTMISIIMEKRFKGEQAT